VHFAKSKIICACGGMDAYLDVLDLSNLIIGTEIRMESGEPSYHNW